jgi:hypothetical protein
MPNDALLRIPLWVIHDGFSRRPRLVDVRFAPK